MNTDNKIDVDRFLKKLDSFFNKNDMRGAKNLILFWENEARNAGDDRGLLTILNEEIGFYRRNGKKNIALSKVEESIKLIEKLGLENSLSIATIYVNIATTYAFLGKEGEGLDYYNKAEICFKANNKLETYEYAALLNNKAGTLSTLKKYDESEKDYLSAIDILKMIGNHDSEIALSYVMLAHITFDKTDNPDDLTYEKVESLLDESIKYLTKETIVRDGNFAYILRKCAPSFDYFKRPSQAKEMRDLANKIYYEQ